MPTSQTSQHGLTPFPTTRLFSRVLANVHAGSADKWWLRADHSHECRGEMGELASQLVQPCKVQAGSILKQEPTKLVLRWKPKTQNVDWVVKAYYSTSWRRGLRRRRHAYREALSLMCAKARNLPVPAIFGFGTLRGRRGLRCVAACTQHMRLESMRGHFLARPDEDAVRPLLSRAATLLQKLYHAGCNHVDFGPHAIMISPNSPRQDVLIDFESATFLHQPSPRTLAAQAGYFAWSVATNREWIKRQQMEEWFADVLRQLDIPSTSDLWELWRTCLHDRQPLKWRMAIR